MSTPPKTGMPTQPPRPTPGQPLVWQPLPPGARTLIRRLDVGEVLSFDHGRIQLSLEEKSGRRASLRVVVLGDVRVDK